jgi:hypothetical protein
MEHEVIEGNKWVLANMWHELLGSYSDIRKDANRWLDVLKRY